MGDYEGMDVDELIKLHALFEAHISKSLVGTTATVDDSNKFREMERELTRRET